MGLAASTQVALAALAHSLIVQLILPRSARSNSSLSVRAERHESDLVAQANDIAASPAWLAMEARVEACRAQLPLEPSALLPWLIEQPMDTLQDMLALCVSLSLTAMTSREDKPVAEELANAVGLDMADHWEPTAASYLRQVTKERIVIAVTEAVSADAAQPLEKMKKGEAVLAAEALLAQTRWLPPVLRTRRM